jgi:hypothetical protein
MQLKESVKPVSHLTPIIAEKLLKHKVDIQAFAVDSTIDLLEIY